MLRRLALITSLLFAAVVLVFAAGVERPTRTPDRTADHQVGAMSAILGCVPFPAASVAEDRLPSPGDRCIERAHGDVRIDRIAIPEC